MAKISRKTLLDLEFDEVLNQIAVFCHTDVARQQILHQTPDLSLDEADEVLTEIEEYTHLLSGDKGIPHHEFDTVFSELQLLNIDNSVLEIPSFVKILTLCNTTRELQVFFEKFKDFYRALFNKSVEMVYEPRIARLISAVFNRFGEIKDDATPKLESIRQKIRALKGKINASFNEALMQATEADYLDEIRESIVNDKRVLAVKAMYRKRVKGMLMGTSKTGSIVFIEPEITFQYSRELQDLSVEEQEEIARIVKRLTEAVRPFKEIIAAYQRYLIAMDVISGKAKYARSIQAVKPQLSRDRKLLLKEAYHPVLLYTNRLKNKQVYPQTFTMNPESRIIVISGPNAGGKSITLKTVGLLQLMIQSGIPVPVAKDSCFCFFTNILADIGDNQSIENHVSTYSYRLKMMNRFLKKCNADTLFVIDEFGSGSDPELGGALAETFLEVFYEREAFGVITTHYTNLKILANELPCALNANMQFDQRNLEPLYRLHLGEAGSSFTFEVAQKNGIPYGLINRAKKKIERSKIRLDKTIADLQKERNKLQQTTEKLKNQEQKNKEENKILEQTNQKIRFKLESYQELFDSHQKLIYLGKKISRLVENYAWNKNKKNIIAEFLKIVEMEVAKLKAVSREEKEKIVQKEKRLEENVEKEIQAIRIRKKNENERKKIQAALVPRKELRVGDMVRIKNGKSTGTIDAIKKGKVTVNYGTFSASIRMEEIEFVGRK